MTNVAVTGSFDDLRSRQVRFLEEASKVGRVHVLLWSDEAVQAVNGAPPRFPQEERLYLLKAIRYVSGVSLVPSPVVREALPHLAEFQPEVWVVDEADDSSRKRAYCRDHKLEYRVLTEADLQGYPAPPPASPAPLARKKVIVTGSFDWLHSGHVRFFEEAAELGELYVAVGHDANIRLLKGAGHPLFPQAERVYMVQAMRYVAQAFVTSGHGWMDAAPEITRLRPDIYVVNEDGDKLEKRQFCQAHGLEYVVLKRTPKDNLPRRESTALRGF